MQKCAVCVLKEQGVINAEEYVLQRYAQLDPTKPPNPLDAEAADAVFVMFPEEVEAGRPIPPSGGIMGTAKALYRAIGFAWEHAKAAVEEVPQSRKTAQKRRKTTLYD